MTLSELIQYAMVTPDVTGNMNIYIQSEDEIIKLTSDMIIPSCSHHSNGDLIIDVSKYV